MLAIWLQVAFQASQPGPSAPCSLPHRCRSVFYHSHVLPSILGWAQDCSCQSCCGNRIASPIPRWPLSLLRFWKAGVLPRRPASGGDAFKPVASSCAPCCAWRGAGWTGASTSRTSCQALREAVAPGCLLVRPTAQQLLGKVELLRTAETAVQRDRAAPGCASLSTRSALPGAPVHLR